MLSALITVLLCFDCLACVVCAQQLWDHGKLEVADIAQDSETAVRLEMDPPVPSLDLNQVFVAFSE